MFRVTQNSIQQGMSRLKGHAYNAFATGRHWAGMLDRAVDMGRRAYGVSRYWTRAAWVARWGLGWRRA